MNTRQSQPIDSVSESAVGPNYRGLPSLTFLKAFLKRNIFLSIVVGALYSPIALVLFLGANNEYTSGIVLKYDPTDAIDFDMITISGFPAVISALTAPGTGEEFFVELARRFPPSEKLLPMERLPILGEYLRRWFPLKKVEANPDQLRDQALNLQKKVSLIADYERRIANFGVLTAIEVSASRAQALAQAAANLIIETYYAMQIERIGALTQTLKHLLQKDQVKEMVERAISTAQKKGTTKSSPTNQEAGIEIRIRQNAVQEQIKELTVRMQEDRERKIKLEGEITSLAQRYGAYHPQIKALQAQLADINSASKQKQMAADLTRLQDQFLTYEAEATALGVSDREETMETVDKVVQRLALRLDRYNLELISLKEQRAEPARRVRLQMLGTPPMPLLASKNVKPKMAAFLAGLGLALMFFTMLVRELVSGRVKDPWPVSWILQRPCLGALSKSVERNLGWMDPETVRTIRVQLMGSKADVRKARPLLELRQLSYGLRSNCEGRVVLMVKTSPQARCGRVLHNLANLYGCDYPGRLLVIDLDGRDPLFTEAQSVSEGSVLDYLSRRFVWKQICRPRDQRRSYDLLPAPHTGDQRIAELLGSEAFSEMIHSALKIYQTIFIVGFGPEQFVENNALLEHATDCLLIVESPRTQFSQLLKLQADLKGDKLRGFMHVEV